MVATHAHELDVAIERGEHPLQVADLQWAQRVGEWKGVNQVATAVVIVIVIVRVFDTVC